MKVAKQFAEICKKHRVADLYAFGRRSAEIAAREGGQEVKHAENPCSDVDIAVLPIDMPRFGPLERVSLAIAIEDLFDVSREPLVPPSHQS